MDKMGSGMLGSGPGGRGRGNHRRKTTEQCCNFSRYRIADDEVLTWETEVMEANEGSVEETGPEETDIDCFLKDLWAVFILY